MWLCCDDTWNQIQVPHAMWTRITEAYEPLATLRDGAKPVAKVLQVANGQDAQIFMDSVQKIDVDAHNTQVDHGIPAPCVLTSTAWQTSHSNSVMMSILAKQQRAMALRI